MPFRGRSSLQENGWISPARVAANRFSCASREHYTFSVVSHPPLSRPVVKVVNPQGSYPFLNKKFKDFSRTHFPFFKDSIQCKKRLECMSFFSSVWQQEQWEGLSARLLLLGTWKSRLDKVSTEIQGLSSTHCNFQGLFKALNFHFKNSRTFKDF